MKKASIISIGNEILSGYIVDTNAAYLESKLLSINIPVVSSYAVPDCIDSIIRALRLSFEDADIILVTGGLGPTDDDLTRHAIAKFLGVELKLDSALLEKIRNYFMSRGIEMPVKNEIQAHIPKGAEILENDIGTAAGIEATKNGRLIFAMPGVPSEMKKMFEDSVWMRMQDVSIDQTIFVRKLKCFGEGESAVAQKLGDMMARERNPLINITVSYGIITLYIVSKAQGIESAKMLAEKDEKQIRGLLGKVVYGVEEQTLAEVVGEKLAEKNKTLAIAESCTGGLVAKLITDVSGASKYFTYGWVTYSNKAKIDQIGVPADLIEKYGAVSGEVAEAMANGARMKSGADFALGLTGIAGPAGGSKDKPVGLVYISLSSDNNCQTQRYIFSHERSFMRMRAAQTALNMLRLAL